MKSYIGLYLIFTFSVLKRSGSGSVPANLWRQTGHPTGSWWSDATARASYAMTTTTIDVLKSAPKTNFWLRLWNQSLEYSQDQFGFKLPSEL